MRILATRPGEEHFHLFEKLPSQIYAEQVLLQNGSDKINMTYFEAAYVIVDEDKPLARVALYINPNLTQDGKPTACLGNYESIDNREASKLLLSYAINEAKAKGAEYIIGPMNGSTWDDYRFNTKQGESTFFMEKQHPLYYNEHFKEVGFSEMANYFSSLDSQMTYDHSTVLEKASAFVKKGLTIRNIDLNNFDNELKRLYPFIKEAFQNNYLYSPISWEYFKEKYQQAKAVIDPHFVTIAEDIKGEIVGFYFCVQDLFHPNEKRLIIKTAARKAGEEWRGLGHVMANEVYRKADGRGFKSTIHAFIKQEGYSTKISKNFSGKQFKNYALYGLSI